MKKAAGYVRVSTPGQVEGESLSTQRQQITDFAKSKQWELTNIYADEGMSGAKVEYRTGFKQMLLDAQAGKFEVVIFTKLSRFARNAREYMNLAYELEKQGVLLASVKEGIDPTTRSGKMIAGMLALFAEWEHETIREQMYDNRTEVWKDQRTFIGQPPYGYRWNKEIKQLQVNEDEAKIYRDVVRMYVDQGLSFRDICIKMTEKGIKYKRARWSNTSLNYMLKNPAYYGHYVVNQYEYEDSKRGVGTRRTKKLKPAEQHIVFNIPALVSKTRWDQIQAKTNFNKVKSKRADQTKDFYLRDVLKCALCGAPAKPRIGSQRNDGTAPRYYVCYWAGTSAKSLQAAQKHKCPLPFIKADVAEKAVWADVVVMFALNPDKGFGDLFKPEKYESKKTELEQSRESLTEDLKAAKRAKENLYKLLTFDDLDPEELRARLRSNKDEILRLESSLTDIQAELSELVTILDKEREVRNFLTKNKERLKRLRKDIANLSLDDRKLLIEGMLKGPIIVDHQPDSEEDGPGGPVLDYKLRFNPEIIQRFMDEGKITKLDNYSPHDPSSPHL